MELMTQNVVQTRSMQEWVIKKALTTIEEMNKIAYKNYCATLMKVRTQQTQTFAIPGNVLEL